MQHDDDHIGQGSGRGRARWAILALVVVAVVAAFVTYRWVSGSAKPVAIDDVVAPTGSTQPSRPTELRPAQGVYTYSGEGTDSLDKPPRSQAQGPEMPATVTHHDDGCWTFRIDYSTNHWQTWDYCTVDGDLTERGGTTYQRWDFGVYVNESTSTFTCDDAPTIRRDQRPGDEWTQSCSGTTTGTEGTTYSSGPYRFVGEETLDIGDRRVRAYHYNRSRTTSGNQSGSESSDVWFAVDNGMPLRNERDLAARMTTVIGDVSYTEVGMFELADMTPRRDETEATQPVEGEN